MLDGETVPVIHRLGEHPGVPTAGPVGGDLLLEDDHLGARVELLEEEGGPQPGESRADHGDVGLPRTLAGRDRPRRTA